MNIIERTGTFNVLFYELQGTNSRSTKEAMVAYFKKMNLELVDDLTYIFETLAGKHPIGWTFEARPMCNTTVAPAYNTIKDIIKACESLSPKTYINTYAIEAKLGPLGVFIEDIVNRTLRLGIGNSQLEKSAITPMLAKKYEGQPLPVDVAITEKLDGNRCIAHYDKDTEKWCFTSRSGKVMNVNFDMTGMDTSYIYDGEVMSKEQTRLSALRYETILDGKSADEFGYDTKNSQLLFNETSGLINRHGTKSGLIYNVFDVVSNKPYTDRRGALSLVDTNHTSDVRILPVFYCGCDTDIIDGLLDNVVRMGGEGVMLNLMSRTYEHKRTGNLLKYKQVQFMDMQVVGIQWGTGKYDGMVGALQCQIKTEDGIYICCEVGTGLSDAQREEWAYYKDEIIGKIVQVGYHELTQDREYVGTKIYSLRFPRLIKVRNDKHDTSEF